MLSRYQSVIGLVLLHYSHVAVVNISQTHSPALTVNIRQGHTGGVALRASPHLRDTLTRQNAKVVG
jgi:hypothetical protein